MSPPSPTQLYVVLHVDVIDFVMDHLGHVDTETMS